MKFSVDIVNEVGNRRCQNLTRLFCRKIFTALLKEPKFKFLKNYREIGISVILASNAKSRKLNYKHRGLDRATNVLSFPLFSNTRGIKKARQNLINLGDIVIAPAAVKSEAASSNMSFYSQFFWVLSHGILHTLGLDHERSRKERERVEFIEKRLRRKVLRAR
ncbi:MAG: rRNA maturation RNase YbeY [Candidatus Sungbacteria bacterium]|nr:rRNA maturation RNase YbeY [Candidatus Sungbacteria bacterium]